MAAPVAVSETRLGAKHGYTINSSPATSCGHHRRCHFCARSNTTVWACRFGVTVLLANVHDRD
jgi:hypothetical protein